MTRNHLQHGPATDHYHDTLGVDRVPLASQLLGPYTVTPDSADFENVSCLPVGGLLPLGAWVTTAWAVVDSGFDGDTPIISIVLAADTVTAGPAVVEQVDISSSTSPRAALYGDLTAPVPRPTEITDDDLHLAVIVGWNTTAPITGSCRVYAIIAIPV